MTANDLTFHQWVDISQTAAIILVVITQVAILRALRSEVRRATSPPT